MEESKTKLLNVTDLSSYLYCPRKFYLQKVKGLRDQPNKAMIKGLIRHKILEEFSNNEQSLIDSFGSVDKKEIIQRFGKLLDLLIKKVFSKNYPMIEKFNISRKELYKKVVEAMQNEILLRAGSVDDAIKKGFIGKDIWENLEPKYITEMPLYSEKLGLKGRADRVMISPGMVIPFELKTRATDKVWDSDEVQVTAYAMMLEEKYPVKIPVGILEAGDIKHEIQIDEEKKRKVLDLIEEVNFLLKNGKPKYPSSFSKCRTCNFEEQCDELG